ncbi:MAG: Endonuclease/exonuclease/phosphatase [Ferruginibacter sp.]|nr:Endonuclease/exonuclease/phosphatase [Ferruginibacter sp.]
MKKIFTLFALVASLIATAGNSPTVSTGLVISQIYVNGGSTGATYQYKFVELYNPTSSPISLNGLSIQYASPTGTTAQPYALSTTATIPAGRYYLIQGASNGANGTTFTADQTVGINPGGSATGGRIFLVNGTTGLSGTAANLCSNPAVIDMIAYGSGPSCAEGTAVASGWSVTTSLIRTAANLDTDNNSTDFTTSNPPFPRNSSYFVTPIALENFSALKMNSTAQFNWKVNCNSTSVKFDVQRSSNNSSFSNVYSESATQARCQAPFNYTDAAPLAGVSYYRLKITDVDGAVSYSNTATLKFDNASGIYLSPAVTVSETQIAFSSKTAGLSTWMIHDISGRLVKKFTYQMTVGENRIPVNVSDLPKGQYQVSGATVEGRTPVLRMIKQ